MDFTSDDLASVNRAILALGTGERVAEVRYADGRTVKYSEASLPNLIAIRDLIRNDLSTSTATDPSRQVGGVTLAEWSRD